MLKTTLIELSSHREKPCISMIVSTEYSSFLEKETIRTTFKHNIYKIAEMIDDAGYDDKIEQKIISSIKNLIEQVDFSFLQKGIGIFVSPTYTKFVSFPFPVNDLLVLNDHFDVSEIEASMNKIFDYGVLILSKGMSRFFEGNGTIIKEIKNDNFPLSYEQKFEVNRTSRYSFYNEEESKIDEVRTGNYFRKVDKMIHEQTKKPLILLGLNENLVSFKSVRKTKNPIIAEIIGGHDKSTTAKIAELVWPEIEKYSRKKMLQTSKF